MAKQSPNSVTEVSRRKYLVAAGVTGAGGLIAGCSGDGGSGGSGGDGGNGSNTGGDSDQTIEIITGQTDENTQENWQAAGDAYEEETGVTVEFEFLGVEDANQTILRRLQAGNPPEIGQRTFGYFAEFVGDDILYPVSDYISSLESSLGEVPDTYYLYNQDEEPIVFPDFVALTTFSARTDLIEEAGGDWPEAPEDHHSLDWGTFRNWVRSIDEDIDGKRGVVAARGDSASSMFDAQLVLWGHGVDIWNGESTSEIEITFDQGTQRERTKQALENWAEMAQWSPSAARGISWGDKATLYGQGDVGHVVYSAGRTLSALQDYSPEEASSNMPMAVPTTENGGRSDGAVGQAGLNSLGVFAQSENPETAAEFLEWYFNSEYYLEFVVSVPYHSVPVWPEVSQGAYQEHPAIQERQDIASSQEILLQKSAPREVTPEGGFNPLAGLDYTETWTPRMFGRFIDQDVSADETIDQAAEEMRQALEDI